MNPNEGRLKELLERAAKESGNDKMVIGREAVSRTVMNTALYISGFPG